MWGTFVLERFSENDARDVWQALEGLLGPDSGSAFSTGGVYIFWCPDNRAPLYVGITGDFPVRFGQHLGFVSCPEKGCKVAQTREYFESFEELGVTILPTSSLDQTSTRRIREKLNLKDEQLIELNEALSAEARDELLQVEGRLIAYNRVKFGHIPPWNTSIGRVPAVDPDVDDATMATALGVFDSPFQARKSIRELASDNVWTMYEEHLHAIRFQALSVAIRGQTRSDDRLILKLLKQNWASPEIRDAILESGYLDQRCPLTVGPVVP